MVLLVETAEENQTEVLGSGSATWGGGGGGYSGGGGGVWTHPGGADWVMEAVVVAHSTLEPIKIILPG